MAVCLERGANLHTAQLMPLPLTVSRFSKIQTGFTFLYRLTRVVPEKGALNGVVRVCNNVIFTWQVIFRTLYIGKSSVKQDHYDLRHSDEHWLELIITCSFIGITNFICNLLSYGLLCKYLLEFKKNVSWISP